MEEKGGVRATEKEREREKKRCRFLSPFREAEIYRILRQVRGDREGQSKVLQAA